MGPAGRAYSALPIDWDADGRFDVLSGSKDGQVFWLRNVGTTQAPALEKPRQLVPSYTDEGVGRGKCSQVEVCDWDGDGDLDLLVGDAHLSMIDERVEGHGYVWLYRREGPARETLPDAGDREGRDRSRMTATPPLRGCSTGSWCRAGRARPGGRSGRP